MNHWGSDYALGHIVYASWKTGATRVRVDLRYGSLDPSPLLTPEVKAALGRYVEWFPRMVERSNSSMAYVAEAELVIEVDPSQRRPVRETGLQESPYVCRARIVDDEGKSYAHLVDDWWYPERPPPGKALDT